MAVDNHREKHQRLACLQPPPSPLPPNSQAYYFPLIEYTYTSCVFIFVFRLEFLFLDGRGCLCMYSCIPIDRGVTKTGHVAEQPTADITAHTSMPETRAARRRREAEVMRRAQRAISQLHHSQQHEEALDEGGPAQLDSTPPVERVRGRIRTRVSRGGPASRDLRRNRGRA